MEVKSLQIGDYVNYRGQIIKVTSLYDKGGSNEVGWSDKESVWVNADNVEPIPLTPEVLEKNGWEERPTGYVFYTDGKRYDNSLWYIFGSNTFVVNTAEFQIKYVHELQHALRLCGIEKEIVL